MLQTVPFLVSWRRFGGCEPTWRFWSWAYVDTQMACDDVGAFFGGVQATESSPVCDVEDPQRLNHRVVDVTGELMRSELLSSMLP